ncbi:MAG: hypothetical protein HY461_03375 [Parcubacteria group bacterium]|nr:hypothetical protein [Parcubacteria group bacterium]
MKTGEYFTSTRLQSLPEMMERVLSFQNISQQFLHEVKAVFDSMADEPLSPASRCRLNVCQTYLQSVLLLEQTMPPGKIEQPLQHDD